MSIFNYGSINIDHVYQLSHFVQPGETEAVESYARFSGGKGANQSVAIARAGAPVCHIGAVGPDGLEERATLAAHGVDVTHVACLEDQMTGHAVIQVTPEGENAIFIHGGANHAVPEAVLDAALAQARAGDIFLTQNETNNVPGALREASSRGLAVVLNPAPITEAVLDYPLERVDILVLNETEGAALTGKTIPEDAVAALAARLPEAEIVLTQGADGGLYRDATTAFSFPAATPPRVVDTTAAGDCFIGYYLAGLAAGLTPRRRLEQAAAAAALAVSRPGAVPSIPQRSELRNS